MNGNAGPRGAAARTFSSVRYCQDDQRGITFQEEEFSASFRPPCGRHSLLGALQLLV